MTDDSEIVQRRAVLTGAAVLGAGLAAAAPAEAAVSGAPAAWAPAREKLDDWLDIPAAHRFLFDCVTPPGVPTLLGSARNYYLANRDAYGLEPSRLAVVVIFRTAAVPFGYTDAIWAKYGRVLGPNAQVIDPATGAAPTRNIFNVKGAPGPGAGGVVLSDLADRGAQFAICETATRGVAQALAAATGGQAAAIHAELAANLIANARLVPAGIVTLNRAQERGYAVSHIG
jgi:intracellular sulfur oxidation DsrE/DsrF family protein